MVKKLNLNAIRIDGGTQPRERINLDVVAEYAEAIKAGDELPPVVVFHDGAENWLADGFHRWHGHKQADKASIQADVRSGSLLDAKLYAVGANGAHGLRRSNDDKRKAVQMVLDEPAWKDWSDRAIADACGVSAPFVAAIRRPEVMLKQQAAKAKNASAPVDKCNPITPPPAEADSDGASSEPKKTVAAPGTAPAPRGQTLPPPDEFGPSVDEIAAALREQEAELATFRLLVDADDKLATAAKELKRLHALVAVLESRVAGLMNEKNAALDATKKWQRKADKFERELKAAAKEAA